MVIHHDNEIVQIGCSTVFNEYGIAVSEDEIRYYVRASIDCAKGVKERTGIDLSEFGSLTAPDIERLFQDVAEYYPIEGFNARLFSSIVKPEKSKEFIALTSAQDTSAVVIRSMDIYLNSFEFWREHIVSLWPFYSWLWPGREQCEALNPQIGPDEPPNKNMCRQIASQAIIDLAGGLYFYRLETAQGVLARKMVLMR